MEEAYFRSPDVETGERACRSGHVRNSWLLHRMATQWHTLLVEGQVVVDMRGGLPARREEDVFGTSHDYLLR